MRQAHCRGGSKAFLGEQMAAAGVRIFRRAGGVTLGLSYHLCVEIRRHLPIGRCPTWPPERKTGQRSNAAICFMCEATCAEISVMLPHSLHSINTLWTSSNLSAPPYNLGGVILTELALGLEKTALPIDRGVIPPSFAGRLPSKNIVSSRSRSFAEALGWLPSLR